MVTSMTQSPIDIYRIHEVEFLLEQVAAAQSVSVVGVSNVGKSDLLRDLCNATVRDGLRPDLADSLHLFYVDCNRMLDRTERGFYELIVRVLMAELEEDEPALTAELQRAYAMLLNSPSEFHIPLAFSQALAALIENYERRSVLVFDEFDAAYEALDARAILNLRAVKDRYGDALTYITATDQRLSDIRSGEQVDEFVELFGHYVHYVRPLNEEDIRLFIARQIQALEASFDENDIAFLVEQGGGHPSLTEIACRRLADVTGEASRTDSEDWLIHREVRDRLREDLSVSAECQKIWRDLSVAEQVALKGFFRPAEPGNAREIDELLRKGVLLEHEGELQCFAALFEYFVRRQGVVYFGPEQGVRVDAESGEVTVDGRTIDTLTKLEFRLLLLLYGRLNKICDKYSIVEAVWGEEYVDDVYDSSIDKLISRLRKKIEPDPSAPRYIVTVRGRGYKLAG